MKDILKATLQSGMASAGNLLAAVAAGKLYAIHLGPKYNAVAGVIGGVVAFCTALATSAGTAAFIQGASSRSGEERWRFIKTVCRFYSAGGLLMALAVVLCAPWLAAWLFPEVKDGAAVAAGCAAVILTSVLTGIGTGLLQVEQQIGTLAKVSLATALASVACAAVGAPQIAARGYWLIPMVQTAGQIVTLLLLGFIAVKRQWSKAWRSAGPAMPLTSLRGYWALTASSLLTALVFYGAMIAVRGRMNAAFGLTAGGLFAAAWTVCGMYVDLLLRSFGQVLLPKLSAAAREAREPLANQFFRFAILFGLPAVLLVALLDKTYLDAAAWITWMLPGDLLKMFSWVYGMVLLGAGDARRSVITDLTWGVGFVLISLGGIAAGFQFAPCLAFSLMYAVTLGYNAVVCRRHHGVTLPVKNALLVAGLTAVVAAVAWWTA
jgi:hypothetical protein